MVLPSIWMFCRCIELPVTYEEAYGSSLFACDLNDLYPPWILMKGNQKSTQLGTNKERSGSLLFDPTKVKKQAEVESLGQDTGTGN